MCLSRHCVRLSVRPHGGQSCHLIPSWCLSPFWAVAPVPWHLGSHFSPGTVACLKAEACKFGSINRFWRAMINLAGFLTLSAALRGNRHWYKGRLVSEIGSPVSSPRTGQCDLCGHTGTTSLSGPQGRAWAIPPSPTSVEMRQCQAS